MKKALVLIILILSLFINVGCMSTHAQQGAFLGGLTGLAGSALYEVDRETAAIAGGIGSIIGYMFGNEMDKSIINMRLNRHNYPVIW